MLNLVTDFEGATEVGGLFLHPEKRRDGVGRLLARSRYLFIAMHRRRFGEEMMADFRGRLDATGSSHFCEGVGEKFYGMSFQEGGSLHALQGNQYIPALHPQHPTQTQ